MAIPAALSLASALAPSVVRLIGGTRKPKPTKYEQELGRLSSLFRQQAEGNYFGSHLFISSRATSSRWYRCRQA